MKKQTKKYAFLLLIIFVNGYAQTKKHLDVNKPIEDRISLLMKEMTLEEKVGQMNQYNGSWDVTGPKPESGTNEEKYNNIKKGWVGSMLTVRGVKEVRAVQKIEIGRAHV